MIKDVVVQNGLLGIATGTFVCIVGKLDRGGSGAATKACLRGGRVIRSGLRLDPARYWGNSLRMA